MSTIKAGVVRKGMYLLFRGQPSQVTKTEFHSPGKGSAVMRVRLKNFQNGTTQEFTFKSNESLEEIEVNSMEMQFLYQDESEAVFMDPRSFEQISVPNSLMEEATGLLKPETTVYVQVYDERAIGISLPSKVTLKITHTEDSTAGNTVGQAKKEAELETGLKVYVPVFVKTGELVIVDTATKTYVSRA
ncbi:MAG: elongation factor P [Candidatus Pacebacteria bacterium CG10_big_fil_rev_8_21_14_0_10_44_11]|nr:MAG: elongation factor P [Candidatus Pacebacteria bacterium CG10_big_fil_rev_8_21_14_0_10_44_11]